MTPDAPIADPSALADHPGRRAQAIGYLAHAYTVLGLVLVVAATHLILAEQYALAIVTLVACVVIDATDGIVARRARVTETAALIDGQRLDDIIDYLSFVFVPLLLAVRAELLLTPVFPTVAVVLIASAIGFSRVDAKQATQGFFQGFPSYWNIVIGYLWLFATPRVFNTVLLWVLAALVLAPVRFLYPTQLPDRADRRRHYVLGAVWGIACVVALLLPRGSAQLTIATVSLAYPAYYLWCSVRADVVARRRAPRRRIGG